MILDNLPDGLLQIINSYLCNIDTKFTLVNKDFKSCNKCKCSKYSFIMDDDTIMSGIEFKKKEYFCSTHLPKDIINSFKRFKKLESDKSELDLNNIYSKIIEPVKNRLWDDPPELILNDINHYLKINNKIKNNVNDDEKTNILKIYLSDEIKWIKENIREDMEYMYIQKDWYKLYTRNEKYINIQNIDTCGFWFGYHWIEELVL